MKYFALLIFILSQSSCAQIDRDFEKFYDEPSAVHAFIGQEFQIVKRCSSEQRWQLQFPLPENVTLSGFEIKAGIWYENDVVSGGPVIHEYHYTFKLNQIFPPVNLTFELLNTQNQIDKTKTTSIHIRPSLDEGIQDWIDRERELMNPIDEIPK